MGDWGKLYAGVAAIIIGFVIFFNVANSVATPMREKKEAEAEAARPRPTVTATATPTAKPTPTESADKKPNISSAWAAAENYGKAEYPYGFKVVFGTRKETAYGDAWILNAFVKINDRYGGEYEGYMTAVVSGDYNFPTVKSFSI